MLGLEVKQSAATQYQIWWSSCWCPPGTAHAAQAVPAPRVGGHHVAALARVHGVALGPGHVPTRGPRHQQQHAWGWRFFTLLWKLDIIYWHRCRCSLCSHFRYLETLQMASSCWPHQNSLFLFQFMVDIICFIYLFLEMILHISLLEHNLNFTTKILLG